MTIHNSYLLKSLTMSRGSKRPGNDRKHFPTEMGSDTSSTGASAKEREQFLEHCQQQGTSHKALHSMTPELIAVIRLLRMEEFREVSLEEIKQAAKVWAEEQRSNPKARTGRTTAHRSTGPSNKQQRETADYLRTVTGKVGGAF